MLSEEWPMVQVTSSILSAASQYATNSTQLANLAELLISTHVLREMKIPQKMGRVSMFFFLILLPVHHVMILGK